MDEIDYIRVMVYHYQNRARSAVMALQDALDHPPIADHVAPAWIEDWKQKAPPPEYDDL